jgi:hypothetical protein
MMGTMSTDRSLGRKIVIAVVAFAVGLGVVVGFNLLVDRDAFGAVGAGEVVVTEEEDPAEDMRFEAELFREPTCGDTCGTRSREAARKFRPDRVFKSPANAKDIFAAKFKRLIHKRWHSTSRTMREFAMSESGAPCTADTLACGEEWYEKAVKSRCIAEASPFPADENACTEIVARDFDQRWTAENIRMTGNVFLCAGGIGLAVGTGGFAAYFGAAGGCWGAAWAEWAAG